MNRTLTFTKMHGAGNDFVMLDGRALTVPLSRRAIAFLCDRRRSVGADGLIIVGPGAAGAFRMTYFNADGGAAGMCGNGARCSVAFAAELGLHDGTCEFDTDGGLLSGTAHGPQDVEVSLPTWRDLAMDLVLPGAVGTGFHTCHTGVPHLVIPVADVEAVDVCGEGAHWRHHARFAPTGTNVNWVAPAPSGDSWLLRTYERGVESETLACGTGAAAAAVILCHLRRAVSPVTIHTRGDDRLQVGVDTVTGTLSLRGPAIVSYKGEVTLDD